MQANVIKSIYLNTMQSIASIYKNWGLIKDLVRRDFFGRYKGSMLGVLWSLLNPLLILAIYTMVFSVAFKARWGTGEESKVTFAIVLFSGMIVHSFFAECLNRAPGLITAHASYVKKVVFPLEALIWMALLSAFLNFLVSFAVLLFFCLITGTEVHMGSLLIPVVILPLIFMMLGFSWIFASLGVYLRDLSQMIAMVSSVAIFLAPIFYPLDVLPESYRALLIWNPITLPVIQLRELMLWGKPIDWKQWGISFFVGIFLSQAGFWWFQKTRKGFSDVI